MAKSSSNSLHANENIKTSSDYLRGELLEDLANPITGAISKDSTQLSKFHGTYMQDDRDIRGERRKKKLEPAYSFMIRARIPAGIVKAKQWLQLDNLADTYANGSIRITTRQTLQYHGVIKSNLKRTIFEINAALFDTLAACGDVNRNVMSSGNVWEPKTHAEAAQLAQDLSDHLAPRTRAYHEIWLTDDEGEKIQLTQDPLTIAQLPPQEIRPGGDEVEPLYGKTYLPRKFKAVVAVPPFNDVDVYAHDLGFVAVIDSNGEIEGWNVMVGGGMGMTHGKPSTFPCVAHPLGFVSKENALAAGEAVMLTQRDLGNREDRAQSRLKYTVETYGIERIRQEVEQRANIKLEPVKEVQFARNGDHIGWQTDSLGKHHLCLYVSCGRLVDRGESKPKAALAQLAEKWSALAEEEQPLFIFTSNQNLLLSGLNDAQKQEVEEVLASHHCSPSELSGLRRNSIACVALPSCGLALAESERYLPSLIDELENSIDEAGLTQDEITIRMTGCPNGCARPFLAEIGFVGKGPGRYNLYLGGGFHGQRLNKLYREDAEHEEIISILSKLFHSYAKTRQEGERFGDWVIRAGHISATHSGPDFHANTGALQELSPA